MASTEQELAYRTFSFRVKDATSGKHLVAIANATNTVWNYINEVSEQSAQRGPQWATKLQLRDLTKGAGKEPGLPSQVIQEIIDEFLTKRMKVGRNCHRRGSTVIARRSWLRRSDRVASARSGRSMPGSRTAEWTRSTRSPRRG